jgi:hypothetical protein
VIYAIVVAVIGIFKQFETLRFRAISDDESTEVEIPKISISKISVFAGFFLAMKFVSGVLIGIIFARLHLLPNLNDLGSLLTFIGDDWRAMTFLICGNFILYAISGSVIAKAFHLRTYSTLLISVFASCFLEAMLPLIPLMLNDFGQFLEILANGALWPAVFWLLFLAGALLGAKFVVRSMHHEYDQAHRAV